MSEKISREEKRQFVKKGLLIIVMVFLIFSVSYIHGIIKPEIEYTSLEFSVGNTTVMYNEDIIQVTIKDEGNYRVGLVYEKTDISERGTWWNTLSAPCKHTYKGFELMIAYRGIVEYVAIKDMTTQETEYREVNV